MRARVWIGAAVAVVGFAARAVTASTEWPSARLGAPGDSLAHAVTPALLRTRSPASTVRAVRRHATVPVQVEGGACSRGKVFKPAPRVTVGPHRSSRPGWAGWLVGSNRAPTLPDHDAERAPGGPLDPDQARPARHPLVRHPGQHRLVSASRRPSSSRSPGRPSRSDLVASGTHTAGAVAVAAVPRTWELLPGPAGQLVPGAALPAAAGLAETGNAHRPEARAHAHLLESGRGVLGASRPRVTPALPGGWRLLDAHTIAFRPRGLGFPLGTEVHIRLPRAAHLAHEPGTC